MKKFSKSFPRWILLLVLLVCSSAYAHERWFYDSTNYPLRWDLFFQPLPLILVGAVLIATVGGGLFWRFRKGRDFLPDVERLGAAPERHRQLYRLIPLILGVHVAVPLLVAAVQTEYFTFNNPLEKGPGSLFGLMLTFVALSFAYGGFTRIAAVVLALLWLAGIPLVGLTSTLENIHFLGFAAFFFLNGRGPLAIDRLIFPRLEPSAERMKRAVPVLRFILGLNFVILAFTEKFANIPLSLSFLQEYPLNFTGALGIPLSDTVFVLCAASVELIVGLWLMLGIFPREVIVVAWLPFNLTLTQFNWVELVGHLPIYGAMATLLVWENNSKGIGRWLEGMRQGHLGIGDPRGPTEDLTEELGEGRSSAD
ncbi:MAG: DoxX protein [Pseudopedobacter sp.]|nr:DoxX protein [Deinococcales bacterium]